MRRASSQILSHLPPSSSLLSRIFLSDLSPLHTAAVIANQSNSSKTNTLLFSKISQNKLPKTLSQNLCTFAEQNLPEIPSEQKKLIEHYKAFAAAKTTEEMISAFKDMEAAFDERDLGMACLKLGVRLDSEGEDSEKVRTFAVRALKFFDDDKLALPIPLAMSLQLLGSSYFSSRMFNEALGVLNRANRVITTCDPTEAEGWDQFGPDVVSRLLPYKDNVHHAIQNDLSNVKSALGRREEAVEHLIKCLEIKEKLLGKNDKEIGGACRRLAEAYVELLRFKEALPICLRAVDIHTSQLGTNSVEAGHDRRLLGIIYTGLEQHEKALEENQLSQKVMKRWGLNDELLNAELDAANMNIALGRDEEAVNDLKSAVQKTEEDSKDRALILVTMGKALCNLERFNESKKCLQMARAILDKKQQTSPDLIVECYMEIASQYEAMNEFETAISLLETAKSILEKNPEEHHNLGGVLARIGGLLHLTGKVKEALPYMEEAIERLIESFGVKYYGVGYIYNNLGAAYMELERHQSAARALLLSKSNMEVSLGPYHVDTIDTTQHLAKVYSAMGSYAVAISIQEKVVEAWESHGSTAKEELKEATRVLREIRSKFRCSSDDSPTEALPLPHPSRSSPDGLPPNSKPIISNGKVKNAEHSSDKFRKIKNKHSYLLVFNPPKFQSHTFKHFVEKNNAFGGLTSSILKL